MAKKKSKLGTATEYQLKYPDATFQDFVTKTGNKFNLKTKDWNNAKYNRKRKERESRGERIGSTTTTDNNIKTSKKYPEIAQYILDNPDATFKTYEKEHPNTEVPMSTYASLRKRLISNAVTPKFRKKVMEVLAELEMPDVSDKPKVMNWVVNELLGKINSNQSAFKFSMSRDILDENKIEFRMSSSR